MKSRFDKLYEETMKQLDEGFFDRFKKEPSMMEKLSKKTGIKLQDLTRYPDKKEKPQSNEPLMSRISKITGAKVQDLTKSPDSNVISYMYREWFDAARNGNIDEIKRMIEMLDNKSSINAIERKADGIGKSALEIAKENGHTEIVELLKANGAK